MRCSRRERVRRRLAARPTDRMWIRMANSGRPRKVCHMRSRTIITSVEDEARLAAIRRSHPFASDHRVVQIAMRLGLRELEADPNRLLVEASIAGRAEPEGGAR
jgi:hypothetical protein